MLCSGSVLINGCSLHCNEYLPISVFKIVTGLVKQNTHSFVKYHQQPQNIIEDLKSELPLFNQEKIIDFFKPTMQVLSFVLNVQNMHLSVDYR